MGVSYSTQELAFKFAKFQKGLVSAQRDGVRAGALLVTNSVRTQLRSAAPSGRLSGVGKRGAKISVGFDAPKSNTNPQALVRMRGPAQLIERNTRPHQIRPRRRRRGADSARALKVGGVGLRASAQHPGTRGKHPWERGVRTAEPLILPAMDAEVFTEMVKAFN